MPNIACPASPRWIDMVSALKGKERRKIANNTWLTHTPNAVVVTLHHTHIVTMWSDDAMEINSGGYYTVTTKQRINHFLPSRYVLGQKSYEWFVYDTENHWAPINFHDGMRFENGVLV